MPKSQRSKRYRTQKDYQTQEPTKSTDYLPQMIEIKINGYIYQPIMRLNPKFDRWEVSYQDTRVTGSTQAEAINRFREVKKYLYLNDQEDTEKIMRLLAKELQKVSLESFLQQSL